MLFSPKARCYANIVAEMAANGTPFANAAAEVAFRTWLQSAWIDSGCTQELSCMYQPATRTTIAGLELAGIGKAEVWWGDGTTSSVTFSGGGVQTLNKTYSVAALRPVVIVGQLTRLAFEDQALSGRASPNLRSLKYLDTYGSSGIRSDVNDLPAGLEFIYSSTLSGDVARFPAGIKGVYSHGGALHGNVAQLPASVVFLNLSGQLTYTTKQWVSEMRYVTVLATVPGVFTSSMTDSILIDLSGVTFTGEKEVRIIGECGAPTTAADAAIDSLLAQGINVQTN